MKKILKNQIYHLLSYVILGILIITYIHNNYSGDKTIVGLTTIKWVIISWIAAGIFQFWILFFWRIELYYRRISKYFGDSGFLIFRIGFVIFAAIRLLPIIPVSLLSKNSMEINIPLKIILIAGTTPFIMWALFSVFFYFGINRAFGADHFYPEYRKKSLEKGAPLNTSLIRCIQ